MNLRSSRLGTIPSNPHPKLSTLSLTNHSTGRLNRDLLRTLGGNLGKTGARVGHGHEALRIGGASGRGVDLETRGARRTGAGVGLAAVEGRGDGGVGKEEAEDERGDGGVLHFGWLLGGEY